MSRQASSADAAVIASVRHVDPEGTWRADHCAPSSNPLAHHACMGTIVPNWVSFDPTSWRCVVQLQRPLGTIAPTLEAEVLQVLAGADEPFTGRQVARLMPKHSTKGVNLALRRLVEQGVVESAPAGAANLYRLNRHHLATEHILALARLRDELLSRIRELVTPWQVPTELVVLFGSAARGQMRPDSDIDVFVVSDGVGSSSWNEQAHELAQRVRAWTGNDCRLLEMTPRQVREGASEDPVLLEIAQDGLTIHGEPGYLRRARAAASAS